MRRFLFFAAIATTAATAAYLAAYWALRENQLAEDEAAGANWANEANWAKHEVEAAAAMEG